MTPTKKLSGVEPCSKNAAGLNLVSTCLVLASTSLIAGRIKRWRLHFYWPGVHKGCCRHRHVDAYIRGNAGIPHQTEHEIERR